MAKIISVCNQKGGVGKTSTAISLSSALALEGHKTLLIDLDPQGNATSGVGIDKSKIEKSIYHVIIQSVPISEVIIKTAIENFFIAPANQHLSGTEVELVSEWGREGKLKKGISSLEASFEYVIVDCPPSFGLLTINALTASHSIVIPIQCEYYALEGLGQLVKTVNLVRENLNPGLEIQGILMTMADFRTNLTQEVVNEVRRHFGEKVYKTIIPRNIRISEAPGFGKPIFIYDRESEGAKKYKEFAHEFLLAFKPKPARAQEAMPQPRVIIDPVQPDVKKE